MEPVFAECFRVLKKGGVLLSCLDNGINYTVGDDGKSIIMPLPHDPLTNIKHRFAAEEEDTVLQFSHTAEEQIGGQLKAGFCLTDIYEDTNGEGYLHEMNIPSYWATRALKE